MRKIHIVTIMAVCALFLQAPALADWRPQAPKYEKLTSESIHKLFSDGPFMTIKPRDNDNPPMVTTGILVDAPPGKVWKALVDYQRRPEMITGVTKVDNLEWEGNKATFEQKNVVKFSFIKFAWTERRVYVHFPESKIVFYEADEPDVPVGGYELLPVDNGNATLLLYTVVADLRGFGFPVGTMVKEIPMIEEILISSAGIMVVAGTKKYVEQK